MKAAILFCLLVFIILIFIQPLPNKAEADYNLSNPDD